MKASGAGGIRRTGAGRRRWTEPLGFALAPLLTALIVLDAVNGGGSPPTVRGVSAVLVWWGLLMAVVFSIGPRDHVPPIALLCGALLLALALLAGISTAWAPSAERAFAELDRVLLYAGVFLLAVVLARPRDAGRWANGMAGATAVVALLAVGPRLFPSVFPADHLGDLLPTSAARLTYPIGYWNGLAIFVALGVPLLLRAAVTSPRPLIRAAAMAPVPLIAATMFMASSRGGVAVAVVGGVGFTVLSGRLRALAALAVGAAASFAVIGVLAARPVLVDGPFGGGRAESAGAEAALLIAVVCLLSGAAYAALTVALDEHVKVPLAVWLVLAVAVGAAAIASDPPARLREFKAPHPVQTTPGVMAIQTHLSAGSGTGRWQFWGAALDEFSHHPVAGGGAGSYEPWWAHHGTIDMFVRNAHSLWLETLGELGLIGFVLVVGSFALGIGAGGARLRRTDGSERTTIAALVAVLVAFALGAAIDWIWQLPAIAALGMLSLGLLVGPATASRAARDPESPRAPRLGLRVAIALAALAVLCAQAIPFLATQELRASQRAASDGDLPAAVTRAQSAVAIQPWAASPRLQLALVHEEQGQVDLARRDIAAAIARDHQDWRLELVAARLAVKTADIPAARGHLGRARALNPRSHLLPMP